MSKLRILLKKLVQRGWLCLSDFWKNGLANHAAAGAYGFLLSLMPAILVVAVFFSVVLPTNKAAEILNGMDFLHNTFEIGKTVTHFLESFNPGLTGLLSIAGMFWAAIVIAFSLQRGLNSVFVSKAPVHPVKVWLIPVCLELTVIVFALVLALSSELARQIRAPKPLLNGFALAWLGVLSFGAYCTVPNCPPKRKSALIGALVCVFLYWSSLAFFGSFVNTDRYYTIYGKFGDLILVLARVYFFFMFFFIGAQFAFTVEFLDALLFTKFIGINSQEKSKRAFIDNLLFASTEGRLHRYERFYKSGENVFLRGEESTAIFYILSGEVGIYLAKDERVATIKANNFFGEMGAVLSGNRSASARAESSLAVLALPADLFNDALRIDHNTDNKIIESLSQRLKSTNEKLMAIRHSESRSTVTE